MASKSKKARQLPLQGLPPEARWLATEIIGGHIEASPIPTFVIDAAHTVTHWNKACEVLTGTTAARVIGTHEQWRAFYPSRRPVLADLIVDGADAAEVARLYPGKYRKSKLIDGAYEAEDFFPRFGEGGRWLFFTAAPLRDGAGRVIGAIETLQDVTERRRAQAAMEESEMRKSAILETALDCIITIDQEGRIIEFNPAAEKTFGYARDQAIGRPMEELIVPPHLRERHRRGFARHLATGRKVILGRRVEMSAVRADGSEFPVELSVSVVHIGGRPLFIGFVRDITERKAVEAALRESEERYRQLSITDGLTGLFNSRHFYEQIKDEVGRAERYHRPLSLLMLDVDNFKDFNDRCGHLEGDRVLVRLAETIRGCLRRPDSAYRYGGEEFVILLPETPLSEARAVAERLRECFEALEFHPAPGLTLRSSVSIGATQYVPGEDIKDFIRRADEGTLRAKRLGKNQVVVME
ncbi:MAG: diguanylate cyclase [Pseudomonadota bacterium]|jgi:diguanylate cyclase (GGDEF)-like protein/PAS domain S-box-containing protein